MRRLFPLALIIGGLLAGPVWAQDLPDKATLRAWITEMKSSDRGPFARIRWFCKDGTILPPKSYACKDHGGGAQHGEWTDRVKLLRANGFYVANILSDLDIEAFIASPGTDDAFNQILIEQYLIGADDGWILRKARFYRGALQEEGERKGARRLLFKLAEDPTWLGQRYLPLRSGARLLAHGAETASVTKVRQISVTLSQKDKNFMRLRNKIHVKPEAADAASVRDYAAGVTNPALRAEFEELAAIIDQVYAAPPITRQLEALADKTKDLGDFGQVLRQGAARLARASDPAEQFAITAELLAALRDRLARPNGPKLRMTILDTSLALEDEHFVAATQIRDRVDKASRAERLAWLEASADAVYGAGLITARQHSALAQTFAKLKRDKVDLKTYKKALDYFALVPGWAGQWQRFHYQDSVRKLTTLDPKAELFTQDQLRGSPLFFYAHLLDGLLRDANREAGVRNELFGENVGAGLRSLNPGLARGRLSLAADAHQEFAEDGIYLLPETVADLPPVAGILTAGEGNPLSHIQLLARNLGIPNVAVDEALIAKLKPWEGRTVVLAVSPAGSVQLAEDSAAWRDFFGKKEVKQDVLIRPDLEKLNLDLRDFLPLSQLRAADSGRTVGPKAAKLGELRHHFPEAVAEGLTIPFGIFKDLLAQPYGNSGQSVFDWMVGQYRALERLPPGSAERKAATEAFRQKLHSWIETADAGRAFKDRLRRAMVQAFGQDGSYGVFVRSDTNVEDLPGFTGAGLNLTVPNVVGFDNIMTAIPRVWASPFTARAFAWRQSHMDQPEHVYPAVLLMRSVPADKSGVLVTQDIDTGESGWISVAVNEGVGGAVDGQAAESLRINTTTGEVRLLAQATAPIRRRIKASGGVDKVPVSASDRVLEPAEIQALIGLAKELPERFPEIVDADGKPAPADIEFGFLNGELKLFQIRPFLESKQARSSQYLKSLDSGLQNLESKTIDLNATPKVGSL